MTALEQRIDVHAPAAAVWEQLHRVGEYPRFVEGLRRARAHGRHRASLDVGDGGGGCSLEAAIDDRGRGRLMRLRTVDGPPLRATLALLPRDPQHTTVHLRLEYDPAGLGAAFGGPRGEAQADAVEQAVRADLRRFKALVEAD
ncbi:cyclase [Streptacidiphilus sp. PB12-B1b]|uniref:SRPBCC family protein n=1 Tax=Streptacidiphilus sp. PB12-B1b TaxID=2705012 RepID=UPI0015F8776E|nr:SRPBCC family protein [Streptacidiphilus sp. PB12-B1b]QMU76597.1 cyclase [Streptacidiphilus sp. PB12-B1b]